MTGPATFRPHVNTVFQVDRDPNPVPLRLIDVADERISHGMQQFSLYFHGPSDRLLPQGLYEFRHDALGSLTLFIVPVVGSDHQRIVYQACFSHAAPASG